MSGDTLATQQLLAAWVAAGAACLQAAGAVAAIWWTWWAARADRRLRHRPEIETHNQLVDLYVGLGERARAAAIKARDILFKIVPSNGAAQIGPLGGWAQETLRVREAMDGIPRGDIKDSGLAYDVARLFRSLAIEDEYRMAMTSLEGARSILNVREIEIGAVVEAVRGRRK
jgi:hypothetical protein